MEKYITPIMEVEEISKESVILTSGTTAPCIINSGMSLNDLPTTDETSGNL